MDETGGETAPRSAEELERSRLESHELSWLLRLNNRAADELDRALGSRLGLRPLEYDAMGAIMDSESEPVGPVELAHRLGISPGSSTELVDRLERAGHVVRDRSSRDRRRVLVVPREQAISRLVGELAPLIATLDELADEFTPAEQQVIERFLRGATERMSAHTAQLARARGAGVAADDSVES